MFRKIKKIAVIPVKKNSQRLKNKNFLKLGKIPLWKWTLNCLTESAKFDSIIISTDSKEILSKKKDFKDNISIINRPSYLNRPHAIKVVFHSIKKLKKKLKIIDDDIIFMALPTSPFRKKISDQGIRNCKKTKNSVIGLLELTNYLVLIDTLKKIFYYL